MLSVLGIVVAMAVWIWVQYLPGYFLSRLFVPDVRGIERHGVALLCAFSTAPLILFLIAVAGQIPIDGPFLWIGASAANLCGLAWLGPRTVWRDPQVDWRSTGWVLALFGASALLLAFGIRSLDGGDVFSTIHHCLYVIVMHTVGNDPSVSLPMYDGATDGVMHYLVHRPTTEFNGLAPLFFEQRLGNAPILAPAVVLFGTAGWFATGCFASVLTGVFVFLGARQAGARPVAAGVAAAVFVWGMRMFCMYFVNENNYAVAIVAFLLWAALRNPRARGWIALMGLTAGHLVGVRYTSVLFWPSLLIAILWNPDPLAQRLKRLGLGLACTMAATVPWMIVNFVMLGSPIGHPKINAQFASRIVTNQLLGWSFEFRALNWPFADQISRTAWNPFPTFLWLPLQIGKSFGQLASAAAILGFIKRNRTTGILLAFALPHSLVMGLLESLDWEQLTYAAPGIVPMGVALGLGIDRLLTGKRAALLAFAAILIGVVGGSYAIRGTDWPVDTRILVAEHWPEAPPKDQGTIAVAERLTAFSPLPEIPVWRTSFAGFTWRAMAHVAQSDDIKTLDDLPVYPSGHVAILAGYGSRMTTWHDFAVEGGPLRTLDTPVRSSLGLHVVSLKLPAEYLRVHVRRLGDAYNVDIQPAGHSAPRDFTFYLHPWFPPVRKVTIRQDGKELDGVSQMAYGGKRADGEERIVSTNYAGDVLDLIEVPYTVDLNGQPANCGLFVFTKDVDVSDHQTLVLAGGHDQSWYGTTSGVLKVPRNLSSDSLVLYSEPYCSDHVPQPGDRYGVVRGPFEQGKTLEFVLDQQW
jgi:hypothetical protein